MLIQFESWREGGWDEIGDGDPVPCGGVDDAVARLEELCGALRDPAFYRVVDAESGEEIYRLVVEPE